MKDPSEWINQFTRDVEETLTELHKNDPAITKDEVEDALTQALDVENPTELLHQDLPAEKMISLLEDFDFSALRPEVLCEVKFDESIIPQDVPCLLTEQQVKLNGQIWTIHRNDSDPFPSNPHAHNYQENMVADLGTGKLYRKGRNIGQLKKKKLLLLRGAIKNVDLPRLTR